MNINEMDLGIANSKKRAHQVEAIIDHWIDFYDLEFGDMLPDDLIELKREAKSEKDYNNLIDTIIEIEETLNGYYVLSEWSGENY